MQKEWTSKGQVSYIIRNKRKNCTEVLWTDNKIPIKYPKRKLTAETISKARALVLKNPSIQRTVVDSTKKSESTVHMIINADLNLKEKKGMCTEDSTDNMMQRIFYL